MNKNFNYQPDELFGRYCLIEQKRHGVLNEKFLYKVIGTLNSNAWSDIPVDIRDKEIKLHNHCEQVIDVICCGVSEDKVERYRLSDVELLPSKLQHQLDQQKAMWNELKEHISNQIIHYDELSDKFKEENNNGCVLLANSKRSMIEEILYKMQELEKGEKE